MAKPKTPHLVISCSDTKGKQVNIGKILPGERLRSTAAFEAYGKNCVVSTVGRLRSCLDSRGSPAKCATHVALIPSPFAVPFYRRKGMDQRAVWPTSKRSTRRKR